MSNKDVSSVLMVYVSGVAWWLWFLYQPLDWDRNAVIVFLTVVFYMLYVKGIVQGERRLLFALVTSPAFIPISIVVLGVAWYAIVPYSTV